VSYTTSEGRRELLDATARAADDLASAAAHLAEAYELLDETSGDRLEQACFRPVQLALGRAKRTHTEFAARHNLEPAAFAQAGGGLPSQGAAALIAEAVEAAGAADRELAELQDSMLPVEAGDAELRAGLASIREPLGGLPARAREFMRGLGR
jgi:hypothetical protein